MLVYHGTGLSNYEEILKTQQFIYQKKKNHWLGNGIYFFVEDFTRAKRWAEGNRPNQETEPVVIETNFYFESSELLDLDKSDDLSRLDAFARHFMLETHSNRIATFAWNGPLCYGEYRKLPAFEEPSYICAIMKGYYGEEYEPQLLTMDDYDASGKHKLFVHTIEYDGIWTELNVFSDDIPLKLKNYKGIRIEFAEPVNPDEFHFKFYGDGSRSEEHNV